MATILDLGPKFSELEDLDAFAIVASIRESRRVVKKSKKVAAKKKRAKTKAKTDAKLTPQQLMALLTPEEREEIMKEFLDG